MGGVCFLFLKIQQCFQVRQIYSDRYVYVPSAKGLPLGNLTPQLFCNVYMNELGQFIKHKLKAKYYIRYAYDFILLSDSKIWLLKAGIEESRGAPDQ